MSAKRILFFYFTLLLFSCNQNGTNSDSKLEENLDPSLSLSISHQVPGDLPSSNASEQDLATFAWNEFFALNWQASWETDNQRGTPNTNWDFSTSGPSPDLAVWETYIHRTELRPADGVRSQKLSSGKPSYSFIKPVDTTTNNVTLNNYWVNLDEDNEIGSCYLYAYDELEVLYMAKSNIVEYEYVMKNFPTDALLKSAVNKGANRAYLERITKEGTACNSDTASSVVCLPCGSETDEGSIEIKTSWRFLKAESDDPSRFLTREVVYYLNETYDGTPVAYTGQMALVGMHIIHKTQNYPAFVFASWEQVDVRNAKMKTIGKDNPIVNGNPDPNVDPHSPTPVIDRAIPSTIQSVNSQAKELIVAENPSSVWQYYQLIGVQGEPINYSDRASDDNYFMANYVIESDSLLTFFHGSFSDPFNETIQNVIYNGASFNMGGCQGCHGQAQAAGSDFSFLLDFGAGKPVPKPDALLSFEIAQDSAIASQLPAIMKVFK